MPQTYKAHKTSNFKPNMCAFKPYHMWFVWHTDSLRIFQNFENLKINPIYTSVNVPIPLTQSNMAVWLCPPPPRSGLLRVNYDILVQKNIGQSYMLLFLMFLFLCKIINKLFLGSKKSTAVDWLTRGT